MNRVKKYRVKGDLNISNIKHNLFLQFLNQIGN